MVNVMYTTYFTYYGENNNEIGSTMEKIQQRSVPDKEFGTPDFFEHEKSLMLAETQPESHLDPYYQGYRDRGGLHLTNEPVKRMEIEKVLFFDDDNGKSLGTALVRGTYDVEKDEFEPRKDDPVACKFTEDGEKLIAAQKKERDGLDALIHNAESQQTEPESADAPEKDEQEIE